MQHGGHITKDLLGPRGVPLGGGAALIITTFTQALGAELVTNGNFSAWTGDNPNSWEVTGESGADPMVTQVGPGGAVGTGLARFYSSATNNRPYILQRNVMTANLWYEIAILLDTVTAGIVRYGHASNKQPVIESAAGYTGTIRKLGWADPNGGGLMVIIPQTTAPHDIVIDNASAKRITLNAQQTVKADNTLEFTFTLPVAPAAGDTINLFYRISNASLEIAHSAWRAYLQRNSANNAWDFRLDSVSTGTHTNRINVTGVGDATGIRVICEGTKHNCYTYDGATWTQRGAEVSVSHNDTATGLNTVYCSGTTPIQLYIANPT